MIISKAYAGKLLREGKAVVPRFSLDGTETEPAKNIREVDGLANQVIREDGTRFIMILRLDNYRTDHFQIR
jgi:hypothetical protein